MFLSSQIKLHHKEKSQAHPKRRSHDSFKHKLCNTKTALCLVFVNAAPGPTPPPPAPNHGQVIKGTCWALFPLASHSVAAGSVCFLQVGIKCAQVIIFTKHSFVHSLCSISRHCTLADPTVVKPHACPVHLVKLSHVMPHTRAGSLYLKT